MAGAEGGANLAVSLEAADARAVPSARIHHHKGAFPRVDLNPLGWNDAGQSIVDRPLQTVAEHDDLGLKAQDMRCNLSQMLQILVAALAHDIRVEQATLPEVNGVVVGRVHRLRCRPIDRLLEIHVLAPVVEVFEGQGWDYCLGSLHLRKKPTSPGNPPGHSMIIADNLNPAGLR